MLQSNLKFSDDHIVREKRLLFKTLTTLQKSIIPLRKTNFVSGVFAVNWRRAYPSTGNNKIFNSIVVLAETQVFDIKCIS